MSRNQDEADFFDRDYADGGRLAVGQVYSIIRNRNKYYEDLIYRDIAGKYVLEYGCGTGSHSLELAKRGAYVIGIDISQVGVSIARQTARDRGITNVEYIVADAELTCFSDRRFDLILGEGILHHLHLQRSFFEISRLLKPQGRAVFQEPLGHNPAIVAFRNLTPKLRTADEHPLLMRDLRLLADYFDRVHCRYFHLCSFAALLLLKTRVFFPAVNRLDRVDAALFRMLPALQRFAWYTVITLAGPRTSASLES